MTDRIGKPISQRQLRVGEMIKQSLSMIFIRNEAKVPNLETNSITVTSPDIASNNTIIQMAVRVIPIAAPNALSLCSPCIEYGYFLKSLEFD